jgi:hypothetical protein
MENSADMMTIREVAQVLRCSKTQLQNALDGKVRGVPRLMHLAMARRKVSRRDWLGNGWKRVPTSLGKMTACQNAPFWTQER